MWWHKVARQFNREMGPQLLPFHFLFLIRRNQWWRLNEHCGLGLNLTNDESPSPTSIYRKDDVLAGDGGPCWNRVGSEIQLQCRRKAPAERHSAHTAAQCPGRERKQRRRLLEGSWRGGDKVSGGVLTITQCVALEVTNHSRWFISWPRPNSATVKQKHSLDW